MVTAKKGDRSMISNVKKQNLNKKKRGIDISRLTGLADQITTLKK